MTEEPLIDCPRCLARTAGREGVFPCGEVLCPDCQGEGFRPKRFAPHLTEVCTRCDEGATVCPTCDGEKQTTEARAAAWLLTAGE